MFSPRSFPVSFSFILFASFTFGYVRWDDILVYYSLNEGTGTLVEDVSDNDHHGTMVGMDDSHWVDAKFGKGLSFENGTEYVRIPTSVPVSFQESTVSFWFKSAHNYTDAGHIYYGSNVTGGDGFGGQSEYHINFDTGQRVELYIQGGTRISSVVLNDDQWHHVVAVNKPGEFALYIDGGVTFKGNNGGNPANFGFTGAHQIGRASSGTRTRSFYGELDEFRIYKVSFEEADVQELYNGGNGDLNQKPVVTLNGEDLVRVFQGGNYTEEGATATDEEDGDLPVTIRYVSPLPTGPTQSENLVAWWKMDEDASDSSGNGNDGVLAGDAAYVDGKFGKAINLDGAGDSLDVASFNGITNSGTVSYSAWINLVTLGISDATGDGTVIGGVNTSLLWVNYDAGTGPIPTSMSYNVGGLRANGPEDLLEVGVWHHVAGVLDDTNIKVYIDGVEVATASGASQTTTLDGTLLQVGAWTGGTQYDFNGLIDDARIYNAALTAQDIAAIYNNGNGETFQPDPVSIDTSVIGDWKVVYSATDANEQSVSTERIVRVIDPQSPVITPVDGVVIDHEIGADFSEPAVIVKDADGNELDATLITKVSTVDPSMLGTYTITYDFTDSQDRAAETIVQTVNVVDTTPPSIVLELGDTIKLQVGQRYWEPGATASDFVDGQWHPSSSLFIPNQLTRRGFLGGANENFLNFDGNGGLLTHTPAGELLQTKPLTFASDGQFRADAPFITGNDNFRNLWFGYFLAKKDGDYEFGLQGPDDRGVVWLDLDQDGVFEAFGNNGNERIPNGYWGGYRKVTLKKGYYRYAAGHMEGSGSSAFTAMFTAPEGAGPTARANVHPAGNNQDGLWSTENFFADNVPGSHTITYSATDSSGNLQTVTRTIEYGDFTDRPVITLLGSPVITHAAGTDYIDPGVSVTDSAGQEVQTPEMLISGEVVKDQPGEYIIEYRFYEESSGMMADLVTRRVLVEDRVAPVITLTGDAEIEHIVGEPFVDPGVEALDNFDGVLPVGSTAAIPSDSLYLHVDASRIKGAEDGDELTIWRDLSGNGRDFNYVRGNPTLVHGALNGLPAVRFDGDDRMAITPDKNNIYSIFAVSQLEGTLNDRLISSFNSNWLLGYLNNAKDVFYAGGWATPSYGEPADMDPHLYAATSTGANYVQFYADGVNKTWYEARNTAINRLQLGGYQESNDLTKGDVAEILLYSRVLDAAELLSVETYLASKYRLMGYPEYALPDFNELGEHTILYTSRDAAGNVTFATRKVTVVPNPDAPKIVVEGELEMTIEAGSAYTDPEVKVLDKDGNELDLSDLVVTGVVEPNVIGVYTVHYTYAPANELAALPVTRTVIVEDTTLPEISVDGEPIIVLNIGDEYYIPNNSATDSISGDLNVVVSHSRPFADWQVGLKVGSLPGAMNTDPNPGDLGVDPLGPSHSETTASPPWADNLTIVYTGQIYDEDGVISFTENVDDNVLLYVNGEKVLDDQTWNARTSKAVDFGVGGWFDFEVRFGNGTGGAGVAQGSFPGFGYDPEGGNNYVAPKNTDASTMDLFRTGDKDYSRFDTSQAGSYDVIFTATDDAGNVATEIRKIVVLPEPASPYIVLNGEQEIRIEAGTVETWVDPGAEAKAADGTVLNSNLTGVGEVDPAVPGLYSLLYSFQDPDENRAVPVVRKITVEDTQPPELTLQGEEFITLFVNSDYTDAGATAIDLADGEVEVFSDLDAIPNRLLAHAYVRIWAGRYFNFNQNNSLLSDIPNGSILFVNGFQQKGIDFPNEQEIRAVFPFITRNDNFNEVFIGQFNAPRDGEYVFSMGNVDDRGTLWLDKNQNGIWERAEGSHGDERLIWGNQTVTLLLSKGQYNVIIAHSESGGSARFQAMIQTPEGAGPATLTAIRPGDPLQDGLWSTQPGTGVDTSTPGRYVINYYVEDSSGHQATARRVIIVEEDPLRPEILLIGEADITHEAGVPYVDLGVVLQDYQGNLLDASQVVMDDVPDGMTLGNFTVTYNFTDPDGHIADQVSRVVRIVDTVPPELQLIGANPLTLGVGQDFIDPGATMNDLFDKNAVVFSNSHFPVNGLVLHLDAGSLAANYTDNQELDMANHPWMDLSGYDHHMDNSDGNPVWKESAVNGLPAVEYDGDDLTWTTKNFEGDLQEYTVISVARYIAGSHNRVFSSRGRNWLFGFQNRGTGRFYAEGWIQNTGGEDTVWHLHVGDINQSVEANFWRDNVQLSFNKYGANPLSYRPKVIQFGGWETNRERSNCQVAEFLMYDRVLTAKERSAISDHLNGKYNINGGGTPFITVDTSAEGEFDVVYTARDGSGNRSTVTRKVIVLTDPQLPVITLVGDPEVVHNTGMEYLDAGATLMDSNGQAVPDPNFTIGSNVNINKPGTYTYTYDYTDAQDKVAATAVRIVVVLDMAPPVINLVGADTLEHQLGNPFIDPGYSALDGVDGEVGVVSSEIQHNLIRASVFMIAGFPDADLDLNNNEGLLLRTPAQTVDFSRGPHNSGLYIDGDARFQSTFSALTQNDNFQVLFTGHFYTPTGGRYEFGIEQADDRSSFWIDLDQDDVFESDGDQGGELMNIGNIAGYQEVDLEPGYYRYAITFREGGGGSRVDARYRAIQGYGPTIRTRIRPYEAVQNGSWVQYNPIPHNTPGEYLITYTAKDAAGNQAIATRTVIVRNNPDAAVISLNGDAEMVVPVGGLFTDPGFVALDLDGVDVTASGVSTAIGEVDTARVGEYRITYTFTSGEGVPSRFAERIVMVKDMEPPVITLNGEESVTIFLGQTYQDPGATAADAYYGNLPVGSSHFMPTENLVMHLDASDITGLTHGDSVDIWHDISGAGNDANIVVGTPTYVEFGIGGKPTVHFDGLSALRTTTWVGSTYSILTVSRMSGSSNQRLITSFNNNWIMGYDNGVQDVLYSGAWVTGSHPPATTTPNLYTATSSGSNDVRFFANGIDKTLVPRRNTAIGYFQMGAYRDMEQPAVGDISEVIVYNRVLSTSERLSIEAFLNAKYGLNGANVAHPVPLNTNKAGTYSIVYQTVDGSGNIATRVRTVEVIPDPDAPKINLAGDLLIEHEQGEPYVEPGFTLLDGEDNPLDNSLVVIEGSVDVRHAGRYILRYNYAPQTGTPAAEVTRVINVTDNLPPVITLNGPEVVKLEVGDTWIDPGATATDLGDGDLYVISDLEWDLGKILKKVYKFDPSNDSYLDLGGNGGLFAETALGSGFMAYAGPGGRGFDFNSRIDFYANIVDGNGNPVSVQSDRFQILFTTKFLVPVQGRYEFGVISQDDRTSIWLDRDQDGTYEDNGDDGDEQLRDAGQTGWQGVTLEPGVYDLAIAFREGTGGEQTEVGLSLPPGNTPYHRQRIQMNLPEQSLLFAQPGTALDTSVPGTHLITYATQDASRNLVTKTRTVVVVADPSLPFIALKGNAEITHEAGTAFVDPGATVSDSNDQVLETDLKSLDSIDVNILGSQVITYTYTDGAGKVADPVSRTVTVVDTLPPEITLKPHPGTGEIETVHLSIGQTWEDPGIDISDFDQAAWFVSSRDYIPNQLEMAGFNLQPNNDYITFDNNGGLLKETPDGKFFFKDGPRDRGYDFADENDFRRLPIGITQDDYFMSYITGYFYAKVDGDYQFRTDNLDDRMSLYMDLDQDGIFEHNGDLGTEQIIWASNGSNINQTLTLTGGQYYKLIVGHVEYTSNTRGRFSFTTPGTTNPNGQVVVKPSSPVQNGLWLTAGDGPINTNFPGTYQITYYAMDVEGHVSTASRSVVIEIDENAPVLELVGDAQVQVELGGTFVDESVVARTKAGDLIPNPTVQISYSRDGFPVAGVDGNIAGNYQVTYGYTDDQSRQAIPVVRTVIVADTTPPVISLIGEATITIPPGFDYDDAGATAEDAVDGVVNVTITSSNPAGRYVPGLILGNMSGNISSAQNPKNSGVDPLGPTMAYTAAKPPWRDNRTFVYTGEIYDADGVLSFREHIDEKVILDVGTIPNILNDASAGNATSRSIDLGEGGWFPFELRMSNGTGNAGQVSAPGFGYDPDGGTNFMEALNSDPTTMDLFRYLSHPQNSVDTSIEGQFTITFTATDAAGNVATETRTVIVKDDLTLPIITLEGDEEMTWEAGEPFVEPGYSVADRRGNTFDPMDITHNGDLVDTSVLQTYTITYNYRKDGIDAPAVQRRVTIVDTTPPLITLNDGNQIRISVGGTFIDSGAVVTDNYDSSITYSTELKVDGVKPVAHWDFDHDDGTVAKELMNGLDGTLVNFPPPVEDSWVTGLYGKALKFDAANSSHITIPGSDKLDLQALTLSVWVNSDDYNRNMFLFEKTSNNTVNSQYNLYFEDSQFLKFKTIGTDVSENEATAPSVDNLTINTWQHVVVTYDGANKMIYINGELVGTETHAVALTSNPTGPAYIGAFSPGNGYHFHGLLDDLKIYDVPVEETMINEIGKRSGIDTSEVRKDPYEIVYTSTDSNGNTATVIREIVVSNDTTPPTISLLGASVINLDVGADFNDPGATANDNQDGDISALLVVTGEVDTSNTGTYTLSYSVSDLSFNAASQVTRTVIVGDPQPVSPLDQWIANHLSTHDAAEQDLEADPDKDSMINLLEYALGGNPVSADPDSVLPTVDHSTGSLSITFLRLKPSVDSSISYKAELTTDLVAGVWSDAAVTISVNADQNGVPANYEKVTATADIAIANEPAGKQFIRIVVSNQ